MADERFSEILEESRRALDRQWSAIDELRGRANLMTAAAVAVAGLLGGDAFSVGRTCLAWAALISLLVAGGLGLWVLRPIEDWAFGENPRTQLAEFIRPQGGEPLTEDQVRESLALRLHDRLQLNKRKVKRLAACIRWQLIAVGVETCLWLLDIAQGS